MAMGAAPGKDRTVEFLTSEREKLVRFVRRLIDDTAERDGEDIVQDVILNIFDTADVTGPIEDLSAYVYQSLRNRVVDYFRKRREMISLDAKDFQDTELSLSEILHDSRYDTTNELFRNEIRRRIHDAIESLSMQQKAVVIETEFRGRTFRELSEEWGIPMGTLLARKSRALKKIQEALADLEK